MGEIKEYPGIGPMELYWTDRFRGPVFDGPTPEEVLEMDEAEFLVFDYNLDYKYTEWAAGIAECHDIVRELGGFPGFTNSGVEASNG